jgi:Chaperone of endosialidase
MKQAKLTLWTVVLALVAVGLPAAQASEPVAAMAVGPAAVAWSPSVADYDRLVLTVSGPDDFSARQEFTGGTAPSFGLFNRTGFPLADGVYKYELKVVPRVDPAVLRQLQEARETGDESAIHRLQEAGTLPAHALVQSGSFSIRNGAFMLQDLREQADAGGPHLATRATVLTSSDGVIRNSLCVGFDCPNSPSYSDSTILLMENNTRIKFDDTSVGSFPANDWEIEANSASSGGLSYLAFNDCAGSSQGGCATDPVFLVEAGARTNALYVESDGDVGIGTANPVLELHIVRGDSPGVRLEQDGSSGFAPQTWDIVGNETSFFVRDVTGGSSLPFRIQPGASSNSIFIASSKKVGMGTVSPSANLHVLETANAATGDVHLLVENSNATTLARTMMKLSNNGNTFFDMENRNAHTWRINANNSQFLVLDDQNDAGTEFELRPNGELRLEGALVTTSTRDAKQDIAPADSQAILARLTALPIATWSYKQDPGSKHLGPMAEDFYDAFGLGSTNKGISVLDASTVALAAIQALNHQLELKQEQVDALAAANAGLEARLEAVEKVLAQTP